MLAMLAIPDSIATSGDIDKSHDTVAGLQPQLQADTLGQVKTGTGANVREGQQNQPPNADAGNNKIVRESEKVELDGGGSSDRDGDKLTFNWELVSPKNLKIKLDNANSADANFMLRLLIAPRAK